MNISIITDSLGMPRVEYGVEVFKEHTWPILVKNGLPEANVFDYSMRARTIDTIVGPDFSEAVEFSCPDEVILQIGVVDAMPRIFSKREKAWLSKRFVPVYLRNQIINYRKAHRSRITSKDPLAKVYTTPDRYEEILRKFIKRTRNSFPGCGIVLIPTLVNETFVENKTPGAVTNIIMYNKILRDNAEQYDCNYLDVYELFSRNPNLFVNDGYHLSVEGNAVLSREIIELFKPKSRV